MKKYTVPAAVLAVVMVLTRFHHFGSAISLPDASLAVFFLAGWFAPLWLIFAGLVLEAALIDYVAINFFGTSSFCISAAYVALIPTYAAMWFAGRFAKRTLSDSSDVLTVTAWAVAATTVAFLISNGSFYLFSGRFPELSWAQYTSRIAMYYSPYITAALMYIGSGLAIHALLVKSGVIAQAQTKLS